MRSKIVERCPGRMTIDIDEIVLYFIDKDELGIGND